MPPKKSSKVKPPPPPPLISTDDVENEGGFTVEEEVAWCRKKLLESLAIKHRDLKAAKPIVIALKALDNKNNPLPKLRKMMRAGCGDYRKEMKEEFEKAEGHKTSVDQEVQQNGTAVPKKSKGTDLQNNDVACLDNSPFCFNFPSSDDELSSDMKELKT